MQVVGLIEKRLSGPENLLGTTVCNVHSTLMYALPFGNPAACQIENGAKSRVLKVLIIQLSIGT